MMNEWIISSSILIGAVLLVRFLLRGKISLRLQYALWAVALLRLLLPIQIFTSDFGAGTIARDVDISAPVRQVYVSANTERYEREYDAAYRQVVAQYEAADRHVDPIVIEKTAQEMVQNDVELDLSQIMQHVWFAGMAVMALVIISCNVHLAIQLRRRRWALEVPESPLPVYVTEAVPTPCIFGIFKPAIYLTPKATKDAQVRTHVLEHELTHYRHWDHIWSVLRSLCLVLHWYNPLVWIAAKVSRADAELACDEGALARLGDSQRGDYGRTLIGLTCSAPISDLLLTSTTMTGSAGSLRERIRLLMARPRNTVLTVTAVILMITLIVGCTFAGAPESTPTETTQPQQTDRNETTEPTGHAPDNDMSYTGKDLPIADDPENVAYFDDLLNPDLYRSEADWYPRALTSCYNSAAEIDLFQLFYGGIPGADNTPSDEELAFLKDQPGYEPDFALIRIPAAQMNRVLTEYFGITLADTAKKGLENFMYDPDTDCYYHCHTDTNLDFREVKSCDDLGDGLWRVIYATPSGENRIVTLQQTAHGWQIVFNLPVDEAFAQPIVPGQTVEVRALFAEGGDPWYLAALTVQFSDQYSFDVERFFRNEQNLTELTAAEKALVTETYGKEALEKPIFRMPFEQMVQVLNTYVGADDTIVDLTSFLFCPATQSYLLVSEEEAIELRCPEIISCQQLDTNQVRMIYRFPGEEQTYCATLLKGENWKVYSNHLLLQKPLKARALTEEEVAQVRAGFSPDIYDAATDTYYANPLACFTHSMYEDVGEMTKFDFLAYFPATAEGTKEELALLIEKYPDYFDPWTTDTMPLPVHRYDADALDDYMMEHTGIPFRDLPDGRWAHYLEETDSYYHYTSDFGLLGFPCTGGWVYDGGAMLYTDSQPSSVLILTERDGKYYIQAHLPALIVE